MGPEDAVGASMGTVQTAFLGTPLYAQPSEAAPRLAYLNKGTVMEVLGEDGDFLQVRIVDGAMGYVRKGGVVPASRS